MYLEAARQSGAHHETLMANLFKQQRRTQRGAAAHATFKSTRRKFSQPYFNN